MFWSIKPIVDTLNSILNVLSNPKETFQTFFKTTIGLISLLANVINGFVVTSREQNDKLITQNDLILKELQSLNRRMAKLTLAYPGPFGDTVNVAEVTVGEGDDMHREMQMETDLPALTDAEKADIKAKELKKRIFVDGKGNETEVALDATKSPLYSHKDGETITVGVYNLDDADPPNKSAMKTSTFLVRDTIPASAPGDMGETRVLGEIDVADEDDVPEPPSSTLPPNPDTPPVE